MSINSEMLQWLLCCVSIDGEMLQRLLCVHRQRNVTADVMCP